jgi:formiminoglutamase
MPIPSISQSQKRYQDSMGALFCPTEDKARVKPMIFIKSSSDIGVMRNGGRNGARYAPQSFLSAFKKLTQNPGVSDYRFLEVEVASRLEEEKNFQHAQITQAARISQLLRQNRQARICHLGGGHDHVYPLLLAASEIYSKLVVINIDAHADTRTDEQFHSGTPFRQAAQLPVEFRLFQIGLHPYANSASTLSPLAGTAMPILWRDELSKPQHPQLLTDFFNQIKPHIQQDTFVLFSLDADALAAAEIPAVSAVNHDGLERGELMQLWQQFAQLLPPERRHLGIYELNPVYDTLSMASMRCLSGFLYQGLDR